jgi:lipopolysaccharide transport system permease protein
MIDAVPAELPVVVYSSESPLAHPVKLVKEICSDIWRCRELTWILFTRDLKAQYRQTFLGYVWVFVPLLSTMLVWMFLKSSNAIKVADTPISYPAYVMLGSMIWSVFTASLNQPLNSFNAGKTVFMKLKVPAEAFILAGFSSIIFDQIIRMVMLAPILFVLQVPLATTAWLFPVGILCTMILGMALGFLMLPLGSLYTDVTRAVGVVLGFGMYLTPVVYPPPTGGITAKIIHYNPLTAFVMTTRDWLTIGHSDYAFTMLGWTCGAAVLLILALVVFRVTLPRLVERMGM